MDNIAAHENSRENNDELIKMFDELSSEVGLLAEFPNFLKNQPHDQARIEGLTKYINQSQVVLHKVYELLVEMNNFFGSK